jgi:hypothetical protein
MHNFLESNRGKSNSSHTPSSIDPFRLRCQLLSLSYVIPDSVELTSWLKQNIYEKKLRNNLVVGEERSYLLDRPPGGPPVCLSGFHAA